ncbi:hypothetical protein ACH5RR_012568 [Cinchona calisaya]|uniref:Uncharacterized protein n=1 Tax=Cinchona calisaya TaxID=153742 RepID=A0ABD3ABQ2_9GENT
MPSSNTYGVQGIHEWRGINFGVVYTMVDSIDSMAERRCVCFITEHRYWSCRTTGRELRPWIEVEGSGVLVTMKLWLMVSKCSTKPSQVMPGCYGGNFDVVEKLNCLIHLDGIGVKVVDFGIGGLG